MRFLPDQMSALKCALLTYILPVLLILFLPQEALAGLIDQFNTTWKTDNPGSSNPTSITIPMVGGPYDVDWDNDGVFDEFGLSGPVTHDFGETGIKTVRIQGTYDSIRFNQQGDREKILSVDQWGTNAWTTMESAFEGCINLEITGDHPDFSQVTSMAQMFAGAHSVDPDTSSWNTSSVTDMSQMFFQALVAEPNTLSWDTSSVTDMSLMFALAKQANPDTRHWDTSSVTTMSSMFSGASVANPKTGGWDTSAVTDMDRMFKEAVLASPGTSAWDTSSVTSFHHMFDGATSADPDTSTWNTAAVVTMSYMFNRAPAANPDTSQWNTSSVIAMRSMFNQATSANPNTSNWDTSLVNTMRSIFDGATSANPDTKNWDTGKVTDMFGMFGGATNANPDTSLWNVSNVTDMGWMFWHASAATPNTSGWDTGKVEKMDHMFDGANAFDQDIGPWNVTALTDAQDMFKGVKLSTVNYNNLLTGWDAQNLNSGVKFSGGDSEFCSQEAIDARDNMLIFDEWAITDGGQCVATHNLMRVHKLPSFDADNKSDVLLRKLGSLGQTGNYLPLDDSTNTMPGNIDSTGRWEMNFINNRWVKANSGPSWMFPSLDWEMMATGDFNGNGRGDILLRNHVTGGWWIFLMNGRNLTSGKTPITADMDWLMAGIGDFDGDGKDDVILRNKVTGCWQIVFLNNRFVRANSGPVWLFPSLDWEIMGTGDFNGNGRSDIVMRNRLTGGWWIFLMNGKEFTGGKTLITTDPDWQIVAIDDFDGDSKDDLQLRNLVSGRWQINFMNRLQIKSNSGPSWMFPSLDWELMGTGDFNGNGTGDNLLRNKTTGGWWIFLMNGRNFTSGKTPLTPNQDWVIPY